MKGPRRHGAPMGSRLAFYLAADLSLAAAVMHALLAPEHFRDGFEYGAFFVASAAAQGAYAVLLARQPSRGWLLLGIAGNLLIIAAYFVTRIAGLPLGPLAGQREPVMLVDVPAKMAEGALVVALAMLAAQGPAPAPAPAGGAAEGAAGGVEEGAAGAAVN